MVYLITLLEGLVPFPVVQMEKKIWLVIKSRYCSKRYLLMEWCIQMQRYYVQKEIYDLLISEISKLPTVKKKFEDPSIWFRWSPDWLENHLLVPLNECVLFTLNLVSFSIKFWTEFYPSMISLFKIGKCESTPLCTFCHSMEENMHPFFSVSLFYKISGIQFNCFL